MTPVSQMPRLIVIAGPTGAGKTGLAVRLARSHGGEIISADSMQVYRHMDIGTAKPTLSERRRIPHHLIDVADPDEPFSAGKFVRHARIVIRDLHLSKKPIFVVGGTGLYIRTLLGGLFDGPDANEELRAFYRALQARHGKACLHEKLRSVDEKAAARIQPNDTVRIIRALEVLEASGQSITEKQEAHRFGDQPYEAMRVGLAPERDDLYERIDRRAERMIEAGLVGEVQSLLDKGYDASLKPMQSLGYRHMVRHLRGDFDLSEALRLLKRDTRHYAKRQVTWFGADREMTWFRPGDGDALDEKVDSFLSSPDGGRRFT